MKLYNTMWVPDCDGNGLLKKFGISNGLPTYQYDRIEACINACGNRLSTVIDGGAHIGLWTVHLLKVFNRVVAIEPIDTNVECLIANAHNNPKLLMVAMALSDHDGYVDMTTRGPQSFQWNIAAAHQTKVREVPCCTIDSLVETEVDLIKLDVEGHEFEALKGATKTLAACKPIIMIEDKLDPEKRATKYLNELGMKCVWQKKHDYLFVW